jgi:hypothetical protein
VGIKRRSAISSAPPSVPAPLEEARRALESLDGVDVLREWEWLFDEKCWSLICRLSVDVDQGDSIPPRTDWVVLVEANYPWGYVHIHPRAKGGIRETFPHQLHNRALSENELFLGGRICVDVGVGSLGRQGIDPEPYTALDRLAWRLERARRWLALASADRLVEESDPFELPDFSTPSLPFVAFAENRESLAVWKREHRTYGFCEIVRLTRTVNARVVMTYVDRDNRDVYSPKWGAYMDQAKQNSEAEFGLWVRLNRPPTMPRWKAPMTWGDLFSTAAEQGVDLHKILDELMWTISDGDAHLMLIGFPIPSIVGGEPTEYFWQALQLSHIQSPLEPRAGFRAGRVPSPTTGSLAQFRSDRNLLWIRSENWHQDSIATRGRCNDALVSAEVLVIGAGALGSAIAELLVRGGVTEVTIYDPDIVQAGNLVRHTLTLNDVGNRKAVALASRLNAISPWVRVSVIGDVFPPTDSAQINGLRSIDVVIDCSGENAVAAAMATFPWHQEKLFFSASLGLYAQRGFLFAARGDVFPIDKFFSLLKPRLGEQRVEFASEQWPREGVGCWHPVFPARADEVWAIASILFGHIEALVDADLGGSELFVAERLPHGGFATHVDRTTNQTDDNA